MKQLRGETIAAISEGYHASGGFPQLGENPSALNLPCPLPAAGRETCTTGRQPANPQDSEDWRFHLKPNKAGETSSAFALKQEVGIVNSCWELRLKKKVSFEASC